MNSTKMEFIPVNEPLLVGNEKKYLEQCIDTGWISSTGKFVIDFENEMARICKRKFAVSLSSGTSALDVAFISLDIEKGSEVITSNFSIISCTNAIIRSGLVPVLIDPKLGSFNITAQQIEEKITSKTKAILIPHIYGLSVDMDPVLKLAKKYNLKVIEDAAEVHGQTYKDKPCGSFGDISIFSFYANKLITTGEGGMLLTDNEEIFNNAKSLRDHCFMPGRRFIHDKIGYNFRMTNLQAAVGLAQLEQLDSFLERKREIGKRYSKNLKVIEGIELPKEFENDSENIYWAYTIIIKNKLMTAQELGEKLLSHNIQTRPTFWPLNEQPVYKDMGLFVGEENDYPVSRFYAEYALYIPCGLALKDNQIDYISDKLIEILK